MSEPKRISPLLDGYSLGNPISDHDGVSCIPAVKENSEHKYIVKVLSIPASQVQLDALLLTGAYKDAASAMDYFKEQSDGVIAEAECLKKLSKLEGFLPYDNWQVVPMEKNRLGYHVYLISSYKRSLERYMKRNTMTHLAAVNLGLDMCAALAIARRAGWMYVDLKPSNIFISEDREYRIGDLGFVKMDSLKFSPLPRKYCSRYSAPEVQDVMSTLNDTIDTYAVGMLLYQIYNNGQFPDEDHPEDQPLPAPANADYEMAEIILKACAPDPKDRWSDPIEMGQALVAYMQRNGANDTPIVPPAVSIDQDALVKSAKSQRDETLPGEADAQEVAPEEMSEEMSSMVSQADDLISHDAPEPVVVPEPTSVEQLQPQAEEAPAEEIAKEMPALVTESETGGDPDDQEDDANEDEDEDDEEEDEDEEDTIVSLDDRRRNAKRKRTLLAVCLVALLIILGAGGIWFYQNHYLMTIDGLEVESYEDAMAVILDTDIDNSMLTVVCTDIYGNTKSEPVVDNKALFTDLLPDMMYKIRVEVSGFHALDGSTTHEYMTSAETNIVSFTAAAGPEDGSVVLNFTVSGPETDEWIVIYGAEGEEEQQISFTGHTLPISGLTIGKTYAFRLEPATELYVTGQNSIEFTASKIVIAEKLRVATGTDNSLTVTWEVPADAAVESWTVHCYSSDGYDETVTTGELTAVFEGISTGSAYTVEVLAAGMTQPARTNVTANPVSITAVNVDDSDPTKLTVSWEFDGAEPVGGWVLLYTIDGSDRQEIVQCQANSGVIEVRVPGATYEFSIQAADGSSVFSNSHTYECPNAAAYENTDIYFYASDLTVNLLETPEKANWSYKDVSKKDYTSTFTSGENISVLLHSSGKYYLHHFDVNILYVIRDAEGNVMSELLGTDLKDWRDMWYNTDYHYCELDIPNVPTESGEYKLYLYFNGYAITVIDFTITE